MFPNGSWGAVFGNTALVLPDSTGHRVYYTVPHQPLWNTPDPRMVTCGRWRVWLSAQQTAHAGPQELEKGCQGSTDNPKPQRSIEKVLDDDRLAWERVATLHYKCIKSSPQAPTALDTGRTVRPPSHHSGTPPDTV